MESYSTPAIKMSSRFPLSRRAMIAKLEALPEADLVRMDFLEEDPEVRKCIDFVFTFRRLNKILKKTLEETCNIV